MGSNISSSSNALSGTLDYFAFFLDESQLNNMPKNPVMQKVDLLEECSAKPEFDMRQLHSYSLLEPTTKLEVGSEQEDNMRQQLIYQFQKDDLHFEVLELLNPQ